MNLMDKLKAVLERPGVPEETRQVIADARSSKEALQGLETLKGKNELELREYAARLTALEKALQAAGDRLRGAQLTKTEETVLLLDIERNEQQRAALERLVAIYNANATFHSKLMAKIMEAEAMRLRAVSEGDLESLFGEVDEVVDAYQHVGNVMEASVMSAAAAVPDLSAERKRLEALKQRYVGPSVASEGAARERRRPQTDVE